MVFKTHTETFENIKFIVGRNSYSNWKILDDSEDDDIWIHLQNDSSPYVILENTSEITDKHLEYGAKLCKRFSKNKTNKATVCIIPVQYVCKGKIIGQAQLLDKPVIKTYTM
jgi:predicted ribosome quality control (RQC) complex YloA/Tae2 family protein